MKQVMKYLTMVLLWVSLGNQAFGQNDAINQFFQKYMDDENFTSVYISSKLFSMVAKLEIDDVEPEIRAMIKDLKGLQVLVTEHEPMKYYKEATKSISLTDYDLLMTVRDEDQKIRFYTKENKEVIQELFLIVGGKDEFVILSLVGVIDLEKISKIANSMDVEGLQHLEKLGQEEKEKN